MNALDKINCSPCNKQICFLLVACALIVAVFFPGVSGDFIFDDRRNIVENPALYTKGLDHVSLLRAAMSFPDMPRLRSIPMISFGLDYFRADEFDPRVFKSTNLVIHLTVFLALTAFLYNLFILLGYDKNLAYWLALALALAWAVHPLHVSTVMYVVQRMQMLATLFVVLALWQYLRMRSVQIEGGSGFHEAGLVLLFWVLALMSKEDAILLPVYGAIIEFVFLNFRASRDGVRKYLVSGYVFIFLAGVLGFIFWLLPHQWHWVAYPGRDFNSYERLLTQGRVLLLYMEQIIIPLPDHMRFYYDEYVVSRGWWLPAATFVSWAFIVVLLALAFALKKVRPLFSFGVALFFSGHFVTSNVFGLELVFEHRNYLPLIGASLVFFDAVSVIFSRFENGVCSSISISFTFLLCFSFLGYFTWQRSVVWGDALGLAEKTVEIAPRSARAWVDLCGKYYERSGGKVQSADFGKAIEACQRGGEEAGSIIALANTVILKATRGDVEQVDWDRLLVRMSEVVLTPESRGIPISIIRSFNQGVPLSIKNITEMIRVADDRGGINPHDYIHAARFVLENTDNFELAYRYIGKAARSVPMDVPDFVSLRAYLESKGLDNPKAAFGSN